MERTGSALDGSCRQATDEVALQRKEYHEWQRHRDERARGQKMPCLASRTIEVVQSQGDHSYVRLTSQEYESDEEVVPDPEKLEDRKRRQNRDRERNNELGRCLEGCALSNLLGPILELGSPWRIGTDATAHERRGYQGVVYHFEEICLVQ